VKGAIIRSFWHWNPFILAILRGLFYTFIYSIMWAKNSPGRSMLVSWCFSLVLFLYSCSQSLLVSIDINWLQHLFPVALTNFHCVFKGAACKIFRFKYPKTTRTMLYILLTCVLTLSQMFPTMFKSREISHFNQDTDCVSSFCCLSMIISALPSNSLVLLS